jgi:hypothetical protein
LGKDQFLTGIASGWILCAQIDGIKIATPTNMMQGVWEVT